MSMGEVTIAREDKAATLNVEGTARRKRYDAVDGYIQAYTAKGGADYGLVSEYDTPANREKFMKWMDGQEKLDGVPLYRASHILAGDIVNNIVYGGWKEGETEIDSSYISNNSAGLLAFSRQSTRVFSYGGSMPKKNPKYDRFENEPMHVKFRVDTSGKNFVDIASRSHYPEEQEAVARNSAKFSYMGEEFHERGQWWEIKLKEK